MKPHESDPPQQAETSIVRRREQEVDVVFDQPLLTKDQIDRAEAAVEQVKRIKLIALSVTNETDWRDMGGKPYLETSGCDKVANLFGINFVELSVSKGSEVVDGRPVVTYTAQVTARFGGRSLQEIGVCNSNDDFFAKKNGTLIPYSEIDQTDIQKKAVTNAKSRALKRILGLGGMTWDDVRSAKVNRDAIGGVDYHRRKGGGTPQADSSAKIRLRNYLVDLAAWQDTTPEELLKQYTAFQGKEGKLTSASSVDRMSDKWVAAILPKVERDWTAQQSAPAPTATPEREPGEEG
jgi:hypothetical protein